jgi:hypothetical protein
VQQQRALAQPGFRGRVEPQLLDLRRTVRKHEYR